MFSDERRRVGSGVEARSTNTKEDVKGRGWVVSEFDGLSLAQETSSFVGGIGFTRVVY